MKNERTRLEKMLAEVYMPPKSTTLNDPRYQLGQPKVTAMTISDFVRSGYPDKNWAASKVTLDRVILMFLEMARRYQTLGGLNSADVDDGWGGFLDVGFEALVERTNQKYDRNLQTEKIAERSEMRKTAANGLVIELVPTVLNGKEIRPRSEMRQKGAELGDTMALPCMNVEFYRATSWQRPPRQNLRYLSEEQKENARAEVRAVAVEHAQKPVTGPTGDDRTQRLSRMFRFLGVQREWGKLNLQEQAAVIDFVIGTMSLTKRPFFKSWKEIQGNSEAMQMPWVRDFFRLQQPPTYNLNAFRYILVHFHPSMGDGFQDPSVIEQSEDLRELWAIWNQAENKFAITNVKGNSPYRMLLGDIAEKIDQALEMKEPDQRMTALSGIKEMILRVLRILAQLRGKTPFLHQVESDLQEYVLEISKISSSGEAPEAALNEARAHYEEMVFTNKAEDPALYDVLESIRQNIYDQNTARKIYALLDPENLKEVAYDLRLGRLAKKGQKLNPRRALKQVRQREVLKMINQRGWLSFASLTELMRKRKEELQEASSTPDQFNFAVSDSTIRRDLKELEAIGIKRISRDVPVKSGGTVKRVYYYDSKCNFAIG